MLSTLGKWLVLLLFRNWLDCLKFCGYSTYHPSSNILPFPQLVNTQNGSFCIFFIDSFSPPLQPVRLLAVSGGAGPSTYGRHSFQGGRQSRLPACRRCSAEQAWPVQILNSMVKHKMLQ